MKILSGKKTREGATAIAKELGGDRLQVQKLQDVSDEVDLGAQAIIGTLITDALKVVHDRIPKAEFVYETGSLSAVDLGWTATCLFYLQNRAGLGQTVPRDKLSQASAGPVSNQLATCRLHVEVWRNELIRYKLTDLFVLGNVKSQDHRCIQKNRTCQICFTAQTPL